MINKIFSLLLFSCVIEKTFEKKSTLVCNNLYRSNTLWLLIVFPGNYFFSFFLSRNRFNETRETCSETFYVNSSDFYDSFSLCIFSSSATLSYYVISLRNEKLIGSFLCISIDSFDDTKTVRKFLTGFDISCHRAMLQTRYHVITRYYRIEISHDPVMPRTKYFASIPRIVYTFKYTQPLCIPSRILQISTIRFRSNLRFEIFHLLLYFVHRYNKLSFIHRYNISRSYRIEINLNVTHSPVCTTARWNEHLFNVPIENKISLSIIVKELTTSLIIYSRWIEFITSNKNR